VDVAIPIFDGITSRWTTTVCTGALLLGAAGLLDGLEATRVRPRATVRLGVDR
jgi:putative intracellular protease/amidase